jgi:hypothetical protein
VSLADENEWARICLYGEWGSGKTTSAAHAAHLGPVRHVDSELRLKGGALRRLGVPTDRIEPFRSISFAALREDIEVVRENLHDQRQWLEEPDEFVDEPTPWAAYVHDSVTEIVKTLLDDVIARNVGEARKRAAKRGEEVKINPFQIDVDYYGEAVQEYRTLLREMRNLDTHLVFTAQERRDTDKNDGVVRIGPGTLPAVQAELMGYCDIVVRTYRQGKYYLGLTEPGTKYMAKDAFGVLPPIMVNPTVDRLVSYMREDLTIDTDPIQQAWLAEQQEAVEAAGAVAASEAAPSEGRRRRGRTAS